MANYSNLKNIIDQVVRTNGQGDITGANLNQTLQQMVTDLGANYQYAGVATPSTNPGSPDQNVFYIATLAGTYSYFNSIVLPKGFSVLRWNGSWSATTLYTVDTGLTPNSEALVQSGTVFERFKFDGGAWNVSAHFPTGGPNNDGKFTLEYILANANTLIPADWRKGGMSIRFVDSSDKMYVSYMYKLQSTNNNASSNDFTNTDNWEKLNLEDEINEVTLIEKDYNWYPGYVASTGVCLASTISQFCQPILFHAGETLNYFSDYYENAVVEVADDTPINVGDTNFIIRTLIRTTSEEKSGRYTFETDKYVVITVKKENYALKTSITNVNSIYYKLNYKLIKLYDFRATTESWADIPLNAVVYDTTSKKLRKKIGNSIYEDVLFFDGAIYTCKNQLYIWNGTDLVSAIGWYEKIEWQYPNSYISLPLPSIGDTIDTTNIYPSSLGNNCSIVSVVEGDEFTIVQNSGRNNYAILDKNNTLLSFGNYNDKDTISLIMPSKAARLVVQGTNNSYRHLTLSQIEKNVDYLSNLYYDNKCYFSFEDDVVIRQANELSVKKEISEGYCTSDFIDISSYDVDTELSWYPGLVFDGTQSSLLYLLQFDSNKKYIGSYFVNDNSCKHVTIQENAAFVKASFKKDYKSKLVVSDGTLLWKFTPQMSSIGGNIQPSIYVKEVIPSNYPMECGYKRTQQQVNIKFEAKGAIPYRNGQTTINGHIYEGVLYSETMETDKRVGWDVSLITYMSAINNPYSMMYTENISAKRSRSAYGITYHGDSNAGAYYGSVCNTLALLGCSPIIPYTTPQINGYDGGSIRSNNLFELVYDQSIRGLKLMDMFVMPGHVVVVTKLWVNERGENVKVQFSEENGISAIVQAPKNETEYNNYKSSNGFRVFRYKELYKNINYKPSPVVSVGNEYIIPYQYNNDICTIYGDYAAIREGDILHINYVKGDYTQIKVYKNNEIIETITLDADSSVHDVDLGPLNLSYGKYKACLSDGTNNSDFTYWEIINIEMSLNGDTLSFSSANGIPLYWDWQKQNGGSYRPVIITQEDIDRGNVDVSERSALYNYCLKVHVEGDYGRVAGVILNNQ